MRIKILYIRSMLSEPELVIAESKLVLIKTSLAATLGQLPRPSLLASGGAGFQRRFAKQVSTFSPLTLFTLILRPILRTVSSHAYLI